MEFLKLYETGKLPLTRIDQYASACDVVLQIEVNKAQEQTMIYSFHTADLEPGKPRVLPHPLVPGAVFLGAGLSLAADIADLLGQHGINTDDPRSRWYIEVWHRGETDVLAAQASFVWDGDQVVCEAMSIGPGFVSLNLEPYLQQLGHGVWGQPAFHILNSIDCIHQRSSSTTGRS